MKLIFNGELPADWPADRVAQVYNALDCGITHEILTELKPQLTNQHAHIYELTKSFAAPALEMMLRGVAVDSTAMWEHRRRLEREWAEVFDWLQELAFAIDLPLRKPTKAIDQSHRLNPGSPKQLHELFYHVLKLNPIKIFDKKKGEAIPSTNRESLEKLAERNRIAAPFVSAILSLRDRAKVLGYLRNVEADGRMRFSFNIAGTETGRWSSSKSVWGTGYNAQNIPPAIREIFIADRGYKLCYLDLEQAESRFVGLLAPGVAYWDACHSGDLHTYCCRLIWPGLSWTGDLKKDRPLADTLFYREYSYRDLSKRGGHGTNYYGKAPTIAKHLHVDRQLIEDFQRAYFREFPEIPAWHLEVKERLQVDRCLTTPFGRIRWFHGRPDDDATLREAIAYVPQSSIADYLNTGLRDVWRRLRNVQLLLQVHDAIVFQFPEEEEDCIEEVVRTLQIKISHRGKNLVIPSEPKVGWNWGAFGPNNPDGMVKWKGIGSDSRKRSGLLDRVLR